MFTLGINNGLRTGDLLKLTVGQLGGLKSGEFITIREGKTGKTNVLMLNREAHRALQAYLEAEQPSDDEPLFPSRKGRGPITTTRVSQLMKEWTRAINLRGNFGAHTLRKTFGYHQRVRFGVGFEVLCRRYNHSSPATTMRYLGLTSDEVTEALLNEI